MNKNLNCALILLAGTATINAMVSKTGYPKWDGLVALKEAGLPVAYGLFVPPHSAESTIEKTIERFVEESTSDWLALRADCVNGIGLTPAGTAFRKTDKENIFKKLCAWSSRGYGVNVIDAEQRFEHDFCCNVLFNDEEGNFTLEGVGPGFDSGDLRKAVVNPTFIMTNKPESPIFLYADPVSGEENTETLQRLLMRVNITSRKPTPEEITLRLAYIAKTILPDTNITVKSTAEAARTWLREHKCDQLLAGKDPSEVISLATLQKLVSCACRYACSLKQQDKKITAKALTVHVHGRKIICIGAYDGHKPL